MVPDGLNEDFAPVSLGRPIMLALWFTLKVWFSSRGFVSFP
jgi:hypothetical protein